jgi:Xaa-Pro dipeptidase
MTMGDGPSGGTIGTNSFGPAFTEAEHRARLVQARQAISKAGLVACICTSPEHLYYLAGYDAHTHFSIQAFVFGTEDEEPTLVIRDVDRSCAEETSWVRDVRSYHHMQQDPADLIEQALRARALSQSPIGVCLNSYALPGAFALHLVRRLEPAKITDASGMIERLRYVKSPQELAYIREAANYAEAGLHRAREAARPGLSEIELTGMIELAMREAGSEYCAMPSWVSSGPRTRGGHRTPTNRVIERGEPVKMEFGGVHKRYHAVTMQTLWVGQASSAARASYAATLASLRAGSAAVAGGAPVAAAEGAAFARLREAGFDIATHARFGYGVSAAYPPTWLEGLDITREASEVFAKGMSFVLHSSVATPEGHGILIGGAYILGDRGLEVWSGGDLELLVV